MNLASEWRSLRNEFARLAREERKMLQAGHEKFAVFCAYWTGDEPSAISFATTKDRLNAFQKYADLAAHLSVENPEAFNAQENDLGFFCLFKSSEITEEFRGRFEVAAARAGLLLGGKQGVEPEYCWISRLCEYLLAKKSNLVIAADIDRAAFVPSLCEASVVFCQSLEREALKQPQKIHTEKKPKISGIATNIERFRMECGWSYDQLSAKTGIDRKLISYHMRKAKRPHPRTLRTYAQAFSKELGRPVTVADLKSVS